MAEANGQSGMADTPMVAGAIVLGALLVLIVFNKFVLNVSVS